MSSPAGPWLQDLCAAFPFEPQAGSAGLAAFNASVDALAAVSDQQRREVVRALRRYRCGSCLRRVQGQWSRPAKGGVPCSREHMTACCWPTPIPAMLRLSSLSYSPACPHPDLSQEPLCRPRQLGAGHRSSDAAAPGPAAARRSAGRRGAGAAGRRATCRGVCFRQRSCRRCAASGGWQQAGGCCPRSLPGFLAAPRQPLPGPQSGCRGCCSIERCGGRRGRPGCRRHSRSKRCASRGRKWQRRQPRRGWRGPCAGYQHGEDSRSPGAAHAFSSRPFGRGRS